MNTTLNQSNRLAGGVRLQAAGAMRANLQTISVRPMVELQSGGAMGCTVTSADARVLGVHDWPQDSAWLLLGAMPVPAAVANRVVEAIDGAQLARQVGFTLDLTELEVRGAADALIRDLGERFRAVGRLDLKVRRFASQADRVLEQVKQLRAAGLQLGLLGFGHGPIPLTMLSWLRPALIQLDERLFERQAWSREGLAVLQQTVNLARDLGAATWADGVDSEVQMNVLRTAGVTWASGPAVATDRTLRFA